MKEARGHINLDSWCRFDVISKNVLANLEERIKRDILWRLWRYPLGTDCTDMEEKDEVQKRERIYKRGGGEV